MKIPKQISVGKALIIVVITILITSGFFYVFAANPSSTFYISGGVYPGAPSYTIWKEGSTYKAKDGNGLLKYSGTNFATVMQNCVDILPNEGGYIYAKAATYSFSTTIDFSGHQTFTLEGEGRGIGAGNTIFDYTATDGSDAFLFDSQWGVTLRNFMLTGNSAAGRGIEILSTTMTCFKFTLDHIKVQQFGGNQLYTNTLWGSRIVDSEFVGCDTGSSDVVFLDNWSFQNVIICTLFRNIPSDAYGLHSKSKLLTLIDCGFEQYGGGANIYDAIGLGLEGIGPVKVVGCNFEGLKDGIGIEIGAIGALSSMGLVTIEDCYFSYLATANATDIGINIGQLDGGDRTVRILNCEWDPTTVTTVINKTDNAGIIVLEPWDSWNVLARCSATTKSKIARYNSGTKNIPNGQTSTGNIAHGLSGTPNIVLAFGSTSDTEDLYCSSKDDTNIVIDCIGAVAANRTIYWYAECRP